MHAIRRLFAAGAAFLCLWPMCAYALEDYLYTSSVTYCAPPNTLLIEKFDISYFKKNNSVSFDVVAASVSSVNVTANLLVNTYGMRPLNITLDLCSILGRALCPLPKYQFNGTDSIVISSLVDVSSYVPGIAYKIPDLEAYAQLELTEIGTGETVACVQATLSNGFSTHQTAVQWATGGLALFSLASASWQSINPTALAPVRLLDLMSLYQTIASSGLLALNFPIVYRNFALNFAWALGLIHSKTVQHSLNTMRAHTGGDNKNGSSNALGLVNRALSPYNTQITQSLSSASLFRRAELFSSTRLFSSLFDVDTSSKALIINPSQLASAGEVQTYSPSTDEVLQAGVAIYTNLLNIATANAFMTVFITALVFLAIVLSVAGLSYAFIYLVALKRPQSSRLRTMRRGFLPFSRSWALRIALILFIPITLFSIFQWTLKDSWLSTIFAVFSLLVIFLGILHSLYTTARLRTRSSTAAIYLNNDHFLANGPIYAFYRTQRWYFGAAVISVGFLRCLFIAVLQSGKAQIILVLILEVTLFATTIVLRPYNTRGSDVFASYIALVRMVTTGLMVSFEESLKVPAIPRVVIGIIIAIIFSATVVVIFFNICFHLGLMRFFRRDRVDGAVREDAGFASMLEKAGTGAPGTVYGSSAPHTPLPTDFPRVPSRDASNFKSADEMKESSRTASV